MSRINRYTEPGEPTEPQSTDPRYPEPTYTESADIESSYTEPAYIDPQYPEQAHTQPGYIDPRHPEYGYTQRVYVDPTYTDRYPEQAYTQPVHTDPAHPDPPYVEQGYADQEYAQQGYAQQGYADPAYNQLTYADPRHTAPADTASEYTEPEPGAPIQPGNTEPGAPVQPGAPIQPGETRRKRGYLQRAGTAGLILAALAAGRVVTGAFQADDSISEPFLRAGTVGSPVSLRYADVTAAQADGSSCVTAGLGTAPVMRTSGVFIVVPLTIVAKGKPADVRYAALQDRQGRTFLASGQRSPYTPGTSQPGVPRYASVVIEVPQDAIAGAHLRIALNSLDQRRDDMADIDLELTAADATAWSRDATVIAVPDPSQLPPATDGANGAAGASRSCEGQP